MFPVDELHQGLLDACTHVIPHAELWRWSSEIGLDQVGYPHRISTLDLYEPIPEQGELIVRARFAGFEDGDVRYPAFDVQVCARERVVLEFHLVDVLMNAGPLSALHHAVRWVFLRDRVFVLGAGLSKTQAGVTQLSYVDVACLDWLPGSAADVYALDPRLTDVDRLVQIAMKDHLGRCLGVHPSEVVADVATSCARVGEDEFELTVTTSGGRVEIRNADRGFGQEMTQAACVDSRIDDANARWSPSVGNAGRRRAF